MFRVRYAVSHRNSITPTKTQPINQSTNQQSPPPPSTSTGRKVRCSLFPCETFLFSKKVNDEQDVVCASLPFLCLSPSFPPFPLWVVPFSSLLTSLLPSFFPLCVVPPSPLSPVPLSPPPLPFPPLPLCVIHFFVGNPSFSSSSFRPFSFPPLASSSFCAPACLRRCVPPSLSCVACSSLWLSSLSGSVGLCCSSVKECAVNAHLRPTAIQQVVGVDTFKK